MSTCKIISVPILPLNAFWNYSLLTHSSNTRTNLISAPTHAPTSTPPTVRRQAPVTQPSQGQPRSCRPHRPDHVTPRTSSFFSLLPQLFFSLLLNVADLATTNHQPTPLYPPTHLIWSSPSSIHSDLSLSLNLSLFLAPSPTNISCICFEYVFILIFDCVKCIF